VAFKSIAAYRSGLQISPVDLEEGQKRSDRWLACEAAFKSAKSLEGTPGGIRLGRAHKVLIDLVIRETFKAAGRQGLPIQFHTGFGDSDLDLLEANPLHLRPLLAEPRFSKVSVVLLHTYPYAREAGYLASIYRNVYVDFGLAVPFLSVSGMRDVLSQQMELTPLTKIMYSSDAHLIPERFYLG